MPISNSSSVSTSRTQPLTTIPSQPFSTAKSAICALIRARRKEPPPSISNTLPAPFSSNALYIKPTDSKHLMVTTSPAKELRPPKLVNSGSATSMVSA